MSSSGAGTAFTEEPAWMLLLGRQPGLVRAAIYAHRSHAVGLSEILTGTFQAAEVLDY